MDFNDPDAMDMAQAMGFSSFGSQDPPTKKRRYNPHSDASLPLSSDKPVKNSYSASGANTAPLGPPRASTNNDEISLGDDDDEEERPEPAAVTATSPSGQASLPRRPAVVAQARGGHGGGRGGRGQFNPLWYENYYDPSSNTNPWDRLEKKMNLQPRDIWPSQPEISRQTNSALRATTT